jgi:anthranilate synthase component 2
LTPGRGFETCIARARRAFTPFREACAMLLLIDNYDSFTYNLVHYFGELGNDVPHVVRNDALTVQEALAMKPEAIVLSPGPCDPAQAGICLSLTKAAAGAGVPLFGVCLGHQAIGEAFGGKVVRHSEIVHGKLGRITARGQGRVRGPALPAHGDALSQPRGGARQPARELEITAELEDGTIMGLRHRDYPIEGVQFHPESIRSEHGHALLKNFLARVAAEAGRHERRDETPDLRGLRRPAQSRAGRGRVRGAVRGHGDAGADGRAS